MDDPALLGFIRSQGGNGGGGYQLRNMAVLRCLSLICGTIGMLPLNLVESGGKKRIANEHPAHRLLKIKPNPWQTRWNSSGRWSWPGSGTETPTRGSCGQQVGQST